MGVSNQFERNLYHDGPKKCKKKSLPRGIEPRSPALIGINDKRKSSPLDQGRCDGRVTARPLGWLMEDVAYCGFINEKKVDLQSLFRYFIIKSR
ncbi:hypothetical protein N7501_007692 [Penicillium viridicatum]|nr:hypothetical protein N7501_007692 [Penicillium viridicatum]